MSGFAPAPHNPDGRIFASYPMPAKIDLINERPRRESLVEKELENKIRGAQIPEIGISEQQFVTYANQNQAAPITQQSERNQNFHHYEEKIITNMAPLQSNHPYPEHERQKMVHQQHQQIPIYTDSPSQNQTQLTTTTTTSTTTLRAANLANELAQKEAKLMADINSLHQRPYSPFQMPDKIDLTGEQRNNQQQYQNAPSPRPYSRASSTKSTAADLLDKEAKLLQEIEEMERKPYNPQTMVVEREQWFEYPEGRPYDRQLTDSKRRVRNFCARPSNMYEDGKHIHEEYATNSLSRPTSSAGSIHTTIIRSPKREIDNRSPLPIAFDNFSTKGVRGNIASIGAIEPDRPRPPIYPIIKRTQSPNMARG